ncbi:hypothetical protein [Acidisphaera sp. S103]|uniref:hypothetical protein n=1 Tax=Acidisphaera sp. S103 TaxID=1747223 RepID=UPI00131ADD7F|nr:hypothetical protein [Acidisphaera sp. S103]
MTDPVLSALTKRRAELVAEAQAADANLRRALSDIEHLDEDIRICDPAYRPRKVQLTRAEIVDVSRSALGILRKATAPMTLRDITYGVMAANGLDQIDAQHVRVMIERVRQALYRQRMNGSADSNPSRPPVTI